MAAKGLPSLRRFPKKPLCVTPRWIEKTNAHLSQKRDDDHEKIRRQASSFRRHFPERR